MTSDVKHPVLKPLLTLEQVAGMLGVHRTTVARLAYSGKIRCVPIGKRLMFDEADISKFIEGRKQLFDNRVSAGCVMGKEH